MSVMAMLNLKVLLFQSMSAADVPRASEALDAAHALCRAR